MIQAFLRTNLTAVRAEQSSSMIFRGAAAQPITPEPAAERFLSVRESSVALPALEVPPGGASPSLTLTWR
jgi:hypothetical protein